MSADFASFWQHLPQKIDPVFVRAGPLEFRWYGLMYIVAFAVVYALVKKRLAEEKSDFNPLQFGNYLAWAALGVLAGGRLGYALLYDPSYYLAHPLQIVSPFSEAGEFTGIAGMSYHGGLLGLVLATILFCRAYRISFWEWTDLLAPAVPLGYFFGRIGNFLNGELYGRATAAPWGMFFTHDPARLRHPSQLYEAFFEGLVLFAVMWWGLRRRALPSGALGCLYLIGYGVLRFAVEFTREPDAQLGFVLGPFTMGQVLCAAMAAAGLGLLSLRCAAKRPPERSR